MAFWLLKSEPESYGIDHLERDGVGSWDGVRNYVARNNLMAMKIGERAFFYHSSCDPPGVAGICEVVREAYPDHTQFDPDGKYFDPKAKPDKPRWFMPDVRFVRKFNRFVPLSEIRETPGLEEMVLVQRGSRLSVQPVTEKEWQIISELGEGEERVTQTIAIILRFRDDAGPQFEEMFAAEVLPLWDRFIADGKFTGASLTPVDGGSEEKAGLKHYILHVELAGMDEHHEFDSHPDFLKFLPKAQALQPEEPLVWFGSTLFKVGR